MTEILQAVMRAHRAGDSSAHSNKDRSMCDWPPPYVTGEKRKGAIAVPTSVLHCGRKPSPRPCRHGVANARRTTTGSPRVIALGFPAGAKFSAHIGQSAIPLQEGV